MFVGLKQWTAQAQESTMWLLCIVTNIVGSPRKIKLSMVELRTAKLLCANMVNMSQNLKSKTNVAVIMTEMTRDILESNSNVII